MFKRSFLNGEQFHSVLVFVALVGKLCLMDVIINDNALRVIGVYAERLDWFRRIEPLVTTSCRVVLAVNRNVDIDPDIDKKIARSVLTTGM